MLQRYATNVLNSLKSLSANFCTMSEKLPLKKPKYDGRSKKRRWEERRSDGGVVFDVKRTKPEERIKKRKYALLLGYSGSDYFGMQRNSTTKTIEDELFKAFLAANQVTEEAFNHPQSIQFQRAARTDKGVSAARQVVSVKLPEAIDLEKINENLPEVIRIFGHKRVTKGFNSKSSCDARTYFYMVPTIGFSKPNPESTMENFRIDTPSHEKINEILNKFIGTKNYHNFTSKKLPNDPSCKRYIISFVCEEPIVRKGVEFVILKVKGQSFILHQIRKMIGLTIAMLRGHTTEDIFEKAFSLEKVNIPRAPGLGLVLDFVHYDRYNYRYGKDGIHETLEWTEFEEVVNDFKEKYIYPTIIDTEITENSIITWLEKLDKHTYEVNEDESNDENEEDEKDQDDEIQELKDEINPEDNEKSNDNKDSKDVQEDGKVEKDDKIENNDNQVSVKV